MFTSLSDIIQQNEQQFQSCSTPTEGVFFCTSSQKGTGVSFNDNSNNNYYYFNGLQYNSDFQSTSFLLSSSIQSEEIDICDIDEDEMISFMDYNDFSSPFGRAGSEINITCPAIDHNKQHLSKKRRRAYSITDSPLRSSTDLDRCINSLSEDTSVGNLALSANSAFVRTHNNKQ